MANETQPIVVRETAGLFKWKWRDLLLGLVVSVGSAAATTLIEIINKEGVNNISWQIVWQAALAALIAYMGKNFFTPQKTITFAPKEEVKITEKSTGDTLVADAPKVK